MAAYVTFAILSLFATLGQSRPVKDGDSAFKRLPGKCPDIPPVENFNLAKFTEGIWYQEYATASYADKVHWNESVRCVERRYSVDENGENVNINKYSLHNRLPVWGNGSLQIIKESPGKFDHGFPANVTVNAPWWRKVEVTVVQADYDSYVVVWGCAYNEDSDTHVESGGISSRKRDLSDETYQSILKFFQSKGAGIEFQAIDWSDCRAKCST